MKTLIEKNMDMMMLGTNINLNIHAFDSLNQRLDHKYMMHNCAFCDRAKNTNIGLNLCLSHKQSIVKKAMTFHSPFIDICHLGISQWVYPVKTNGHISFVLFLSNLVFDKKHTIDLIKAACIKTNINESILISSLDKTQITTLCESKKYLSMLDILKWQILNQPQTISTIHPIILGIIRYLDTYYMHQLSFKTLAGLFFINENYLSRLFKKETGSTYLEYIRNIRLNNAKKDIQETNLPISVIAQKNGFLSVTHFNRVFKQRFFNSPTVFRNSTVQKPKEHFKH